MRHGSCGWGARVTAEGMECRWMSGFAASVTTAAATNKGRIAHLSPALPRVGDSWFFYTSVGDALKRELSLLYKRKPAD